MNTANSSDRLPHDASLPDVPYDVVERSILLRSEYSSPHSEIPPERRLMIALVRDAIRCVVKYRNARDSRGRRLLAEEVQWILSDDMDWFYSFARVCESLDLDANAVRRSLGLIPSLDTLGPFRAHRESTGHAASGAPAFQ